MTAESVRNALQLRLRVGFLLTPGSFACSGEAHRGTLMDFTPSFAMKSVSA